MALKHLLKLCLLFPLLMPPVWADSNAAGEEITILGNSDLPPEEPASSAAAPATEPELLTAPVPLLEPADQPGLWQRIKEGYAMPELQSPFTSTHESWYAARPDYVKRMVGRSQKYLYHIVEEVQKRGMPTEIALLPMVESAFNPKAYSTSQASGIWQFIPSTGKNFGLKQNWWVDNRRDVMAATDAALNYLQKLHGMFGSWDLALAAYNAGEGTVMRAIERNRKNGLPTDYQSLNLPAETKNYVPKLQAVKNIVSNPEQYGLDLQPIANQPYFTTVNAPRQIDVTLAAKLAGVSVDEFTSLNPASNRPVLMGLENSHEILLPIGKDQEFIANLSSYNKPLVNWQTYTAKRGERYDSIAQRYGISLAQLRDINDIGGGNKLRAPRTLLVPAQGGNVDLAAVESMAPPPAATADPVPNASSSSSAGKQKLSHAGKSKSQSATTARAARGNNKPARSSPRKDKAKAAPKLGPHGGKSRRLADTHGKVTLTLEHAPVQIAHCGLSERKYRIIRLATDAA